MPRKVLSKNKALSEQALKITKVNRKVRKRNNKDPNKHPWRKSYK